jgi:hypothetical protein
MKIQKIREKEMAAVPGRPNVVNDVRSKIRTALLSKKMEGQILHRTKDVKFRAKGDKDKI